MKTTELNAVRELSAMELDQVSGGCGMGINCNCPGSSTVTYNSNTPANGASITQACDGQTYYGPPTGMPFHNLILI
jgi:hypothetical protein